MPETETRNTGPLRPIELATASVMATLVTVLTVAGWFLPHLSVVAAFSVVPFGVVAHHHRVRALLASTFAAAVLSFLVGGPGTITNVVECAAIGGLVGVTKRRRWGFGAVILGTAVIGPVLAGVSVGLLALFGSLRKLTLQQLVNSWHGVRRVLDGIFAGLHAAAGVIHSLGASVDLGLSLPRSDSKLTPINDLVNEAVRAWWLAVAITVVVATAWFALLGWVFIGAVLDRLSWIRAQDRLDVDTAGGPGPVPVTLERAAYRYPGAESDAMGPLTERIGVGEMVAVVGPNGSGKSTLARLLAGRPPTSGEVRRPGSAALGRPGGTSIIFQQPDVQVLGVRVADDVVWGLPHGFGVDVEGLLAQVGLAGMQDRETSGLSGGELQRLAVAAALARRPRLLVSDESTAMVDAEGRRSLTALLRELPGRNHMSVVHVTHRPEEATVADRVIELAPGYRTGSDGAAVPAECPPPDHLPAGGEAGPGSRLTVVGVSHTYSLGTPWEQQALEGVDLDVGPGEGLLVVGDNGSGKSTLAWIMAGLLRPTVGECRLGDEPVRTRVGSVALAFQHARLQLQRATVGRDIRAAGAPDEEAVAAALVSVGLDPERFADRRVDALSGGQQRRVALAGLLSRRPSVLVLDEPLAGLDRSGRDGLVDLLAGLRRDHHLTLVVISHDVEGMGRLCDRMVRLERGRVVADSELTEQTL